MYFKPEMYYHTSHNQRFAVSEGAYTVVTDSQTIWSNGTYVVCGRIDNPKRITVRDDVKLILADGAKLTGKGITVTRGNKLEIYGQKKGNGALVVTAEDYYAGIGSYYVGEQVSIDAGTMVFHGGIITANGGKRAAGIGGGRYSNGGTVTINGGTINATSAEYGPGIGCGVNYDVDNDNVNDYGIVLLINGGTVNARGGSDGAGIGGGYLSDGGKVTIHGGNIMAQGGVRAPGIGSGYDSSRPATEFTIRGGTVTAIAETIFDTPFVDGIKARKSPAPVVENMTLYTGGDEESAKIQTNWTGSNGDTYMRLVPIFATPETYYIDTENNNEKVCVSNNVIAVQSGVAIETEWLTGTYVVSGQVTHVSLVGTPIRVAGDVKLILEDGALFTTLQGITVEPGNSLTIYGQDGGTGQLVAGSVNQCAAIGGGSSTAGGGSITICGGKVTASGGTTANGIGGGVSGAPATFAIYGGEVTADGVSAISAAAAPVVKNMLVYSGASASEALILNSWNGTNGGAYMHLKLMGTTTSTTPNEVPHAWLDQYSEVHGQGTDYEAAAKAMGKNGYVLWQSYVLGLEPDKEDSRFVVTIEMDENGKPVIDWSPKDIAGRVYTLEGRTLFNDEAGWVEADESTHHFFRVLVDIE